MSHDPPRHHQDPQTTARARQLRRDMTFPERLLWGMLRGGRAAGLKFKRQQPVGPYVVDFFCASAKLCIELDGMSHVGTGERDDARSRYIESGGLRVIRFTNDEVLQHLDLVVEAIVRAAGVDW